MPGRGVYNDDNYPKDEVRKEHDDHTIIIEIPGITVGTIKKCPVCGAFISVKLSTCHQCGYIYPKTD